MASQNQSIVNNIPAPGDSAGGGRNTTPRNEKILKQSFPNSPLHDDGFDESARDFYERNVLNGVRPAGLGINNFNADYSDSPDIEEIALNSTSVLFPASVLIQEFVVNFDVEALSPHSLQ